MSLTSVTRFAKEDDGMRKFNAPHGTDLTTAAVLWGAIGTYAVGRVCQLWPDRMPVIWIVVLHVVPPAVFALVHGSMAYGRRGVAVFAASCLGFLANEDGRVRRGLNLILGKNEGGSRRKSRRRSRKRIGRRSRSTRS